MHDMAWHGMAWYDGMGRSLLVRGARACGVILQVGFYPIDGADGSVSGSFGCKRCRSFTHVSIGHVCMSLGLGRVG
jgi:hypothetical protein